MNGSSFIVHRSSFIVHRSVVHRSSFIVHETTHRHPHRRRRCSRPQRGHQGLRLSPPRRRPVRDRRTAPRLGRAHQHHSRGQRGQLRVDPPAHALPHAGHRSHRR